MQFLSREADSPSAANAGGQAWEPGLQRLHILPAARFVLGGDLDQAMASWKLLLERGARTVYPAHGRPFPAARIAELIAAFK